MRTNKNLCPALRFPIFAADWNKKRISELAIVTSGGTPHRTKSEYWGGNIPWVTTSLINFNIIKAAEESITTIGLSKSAAKLFPKGTLLIALYGQGVTRGRVAILGIEAATNQACGAIIFDKQLVHIPYAFYQLQAKYESIRNIANDGGQKNLSGGLIKALPLFISDIEEQKQIADFLSAIDKKISKLKEKHTLLQQYKKGVMQQLFSQQIRFKDDNGSAFPDWQETRISELLNLQLNPIKMLDNKEYELITVRRRNVGVDSRGLYKGKDVLVKTQFELKENQFVISKRQIVHGACGVVPAKLKGAIVSNEYNVFDPIPAMVDIHFFNLFSKNMPMKKAYFINSDGVHIEKLLFKTKSWLKTKVIIPCVDEQKKIVRFVGELDKKIDQVGEQIEQSGQFKKGLLQQMFV